LSKSKVVDNSSDSGHESQQGLKKYVGYTELLKKPIVASSKSSFIERFYRKLEASSFSPVNVGCGGSISELAIYHYSKHFKTQHYLEQFHMSVADSDLLFVHGNLNRKFDKRLEQIYKNMARPCFVIQLGSGYFTNDYCKSQVLGSAVPVDIFIPGNPPSPEEILRGLEMLKNKIING
jgi:NADH:ubiquinone oxidoreductase subunit B-like Fe-S oxidoreductase